MSVVGEVRDGVKALAELITETRTILAAISDGRAYLAKNHPETAGDLAELLEQMRTTVAGLIRVTRVVTDFSFTIDGSDLAREPARFNERLMNAREQVGDQRMISHGSRVLAGM